LANTKLFLSISLLNVVAHFYVLYDSITELFARNAIMDKTKDFKFII